LIFLLFPSLSFIFSWTIVFVSGPLRLFLRPIMAASTPALVSQSSSYAANTFSQTVTCKLDEKNFLTWQQQVQAVLRAHELERFVVTLKFH
jgi:hypothetical protein